MVVPPGEVEALRDAIASLAADRALRARLGDGARRRARETFSLDRMRDRFVDVCEAVALRSRAMQMQTV
jgi:glycosyltransferase involved in cell wall biosynthesis